jgi:hypothetical protein
MSESAVSVAATKRRETADFDVERAFASTAVPTGSRPAAYRRVESLAIMRSRVICESTSVEENSS